MPPKGASFCGDRTEIQEFSILDLLLLPRLFKGRNMNRKMTPRNRLKSVRAQNLETIQYYFSRVAQIKDQLEAIGDTVEK